MSKGKRVTTPKEVEPTVAEAEGLRRGSGGRISTQRDADSGNVELVLDDE